MTLPSPKDLIASLASTSCPACGLRKRDRQTFCGTCYHALPLDLRNRLYRRVGNGYAEAVVASLTRLGREVFITAPAAPAAGASRPAADETQMRLFPRGHREGFTR